MLLVIAEAFYAFKYYDFKPVFRKYGYTEMGFNPANGLEQDVQELEFEQTN